MTKRGELVSSKPEVQRLEDLRGDLAGTHRFTASTGAHVAQAIVEADLNALHRNGYVIIENLIDAQQCTQIYEALSPMLDQTGRNNFEGHQTQRTYNGLNKTRALDRLVDHPRVLALLDRLFLPNYLLSQIVAINILPGEDSQLLHYDDGFYPLPRPRPALSAATMWAIDEFTPTNGATVLLPGSHTWGDTRRPTDRDVSVPAVMPAGSCAFFLGTLWHGGGANHSSAPRLAVTAQYCEPWLRTAEALTLAIDRDVARSVSPDIQRMLGYSVHPPFLGAVDGMHPKRLLMS